MSNLPLGSGPTGPTASSRRLSSRAPLLAAGILVVLVAVVLIAHAANGGAKAASSATTGSAMNTTTTGSMPAMAPAAPAPAMGSNKVMTIRGATLPVMQTSGAMPTAMAMVPVGTADWDGMSIETRTSAPATFILFDGTSQQMVRPTAKDSFHLMVLLSDATTGYAIPYSSVWATITKNGKVVYDERLWPMISRYMGPHYGNNVALPTAGLYHLSLLVSPPVAARHLEYKGLWLTAHRVSMSFRWVPKT
jgi:Fe2+ transport protein